MSDLQSFTRKLRSLESKANRRKAIPEKIGSVLTEELSQEVSTIPQNLAKYSEGAANEVGKILKPTVKMRQTTIKWHGDQIHYLEFGTGIYGASSPYQDDERMSEANYKPVPHGHKLDTKWILPIEKYTDAKGRPIVSEGWKPYAPFYKTMLKFRMGKYHNRIQPTVKNLIEELLS